MTQRNNLGSQRVIPEILFFGKFGPKNQNYQFEMKFGTYTEFNGDDYFFCVKLEINLFWKIWSKKLKLSV